MRVKRDPKDARVFVERQRLIVDRDLRVDIGFAGCVGCKERDL